MSQSEMVVTMARYLTRSPVDSIHESTLASSTSRRTSWHQLRYAYHEAGHAVLAHYFGRCVAEVSIVPDTEGALFDQKTHGHCLFDIFAEAERAVAQWQPGHRNPNLLAILYGGVCASVMACHEHGWNVTHWNHGYGMDFEEIELFLTRMSLAPEQDKALKQEQEQLALELVLDLWPAIEDVAQVLAQRGKLPGYGVHQLIRESLCQREDDWRTVARY